MSELETAAPELLPTERTCANCACFGRMAADGKMVTTETDSTPVCRRNPPGARQQSIEVPRLDAAGQPVVDRGRPRLERQVVLVIGYPATAPEAVCFDGWRPLDTLPGVRWESQRMLAGFRPMLEQALIQAGVTRKSAEAMGLAMLTGLMPPR